MTTQLYKSATKGDISFHKSFSMIDCAKVKILEAPSSPSSTSLSSTSSEPGQVGNPIVPLLTDEELWETWFSYPSKPHMTLHRWAEGNKAQLDMFIHNLHSSPTSSSLFPLFLSKCQTTLASLKILVIGSILLIRGVNHGPQMGRTIFGRILGERYNDLMTFHGSSQRHSKPLIIKEEVIRKAAQEARVLQIRGNELFAQGKFEASLEHYGFAIIRLIPWDTASLSPEMSHITGFDELDQTLLLSIALTSVRLAQSLPVEYRTHSSIAGSRLYRLTKASCDYIYCSPVGSSNDKVEQRVETMLASRLERLARDIAEMPSDGSDREEMPVRNVRKWFDN
ncbi:uncharacterized protein IL334_004861 [Kwoniella shivajii]|uniref:ER membrane protein complex subunit 2 n=1 Tax=Kwoniella shivajii TaxID=564305 RepID=A0ABZ1D5H7_9TREE|nr:hypothetical protein IL334_004861 [Kwoniella shivajii]